MKLTTEGRPINAERCSVPCREKATPCRQSDGFAPDLPVRPQVTLLHCWAGGVLPQAPSGVPTAGPRLPPGGFLPSPTGAHHSVPMLPPNFLPGQLPTSPDGSGHAPGNALPSAVPSMASGIAHQSLGLAPVPGLSALNHRSLTPAGALLSQPSNVAVEPSCMTTRPGSAGAVQANAHHHGVMGEHADGSIPQPPLLPDPGERCCVTLRMVS